MRLTSLAGVALAAALWLTVGLSVGPVRAESPDSAPALPAPTGNVVNVASVSALQSAVASLSSNTTIVIASGTYNLTSTLWVSGPLTNVTIRGASNSRDDVVLVGGGMGVPSGSVPFGIWSGNGVTNLTIANLTIRDIYQHPLMFNAGTESPRVYNVRLVDAGEQFLKANPDGTGGGVDDGIVEYSVFEYSNVAPTTYTNGVDVHTGRNWIIRHNVFRRIRANGGLAGPAVLMWNGSSGTRVEGNTFIDCHREISLGLIERTPDDHTGGIIRNNFIVRNPGMGGDVGIAVFDSPGTKVLHNTVLLNGQYPNAIEYRFPNATGIQIINNLGDRGALARDGAAGSLQGNIWTAATGWFSAPGAGDLHLTPSASSAIDHGVSTADAPSDWDGQMRPAGSAADVGADETSSASPWVQNGSFSSGMTGWQTFGDISSAISGGVFQYYWVPDGTPSAAVVFQQTGQAVPADTRTVAQFRIGNSSAVRKRLSVLLHDQDFSDLSVCTFWLEPGAALATYSMSSHTTEPWTNATVSFYAATPGEDGGRYLLDSVSFNSDAGLPSLRTDCVDPTAPAAPGGPDGPNLLTNGDFGSGGQAPWQTYGTITSQISANVFEFLRPNAAPPGGVVFQPSGSAFAAHEVLTATFDLGNSSSVRKRVTVLLHDLDFSDLAACTWWLEPGAALAEHQMRAFVADSAGWGNATLSLYAATVGTDPWMRLDNATLQRTPSGAALGTECFDPGAPGAPLLVAGGSSSLVAAGGVSPTDDPHPAGTSEDRDASWQAVADTSGTHTLDWPRDVDLRGASVATLSFQSWLSAARSSGEIHVSLDGVSWQAVGVVPHSDDWTALTVDLRAFAGHVIQVRFVFDAAAPVINGEADRWLVREVSISVGLPESSGLWASGVSPAVTGRPTPTRRAPFRRWTR